MQNPIECERWLVLQVGDREYGVPLSCVEEIVPFAALSKAPGAPPSLAGFLDIGGHLVAVISLRRLWGMPERRPELFTPLVVLKQLPERIAVEVDGVGRVLDLSDEDSVAIAEGCCLNDCATGVARFAEGSVILLAPDRILMEQESKRIAELAELTQQRLSLVVGDS